METHVIGTEIDRVLSNPLYHTEDIYNVGERIQEFLICLCFCKLFLEGMITYMWKCTQTCVRFKNNKMNIHVIIIRIDLTVEILGSLPLPLSLLLDSLSTKLPFEWAASGLLEVQA